MLQGCWKWSCSNLNCQVAVLPLNRTFVSWFFFFLWNGMQNILRLCNKSQLITANVFASRPNYNYFQTINSFNSMKYYSLLNVLRNLNIIKPNLFKQEIAIRILPKMFCAICVVQNMHKSETSLIFLLRQVSLTQYVQPFAPKFESLFPQIRVAQSSSDYRSYTKEL